MFPARSIAPAEVRRRETLAFGHFEQSGLGGSGVQLVGSCVLPSYPKNMGIFGTPGPPQYIGTPHISISASPTSRICFQGPWNFPFRKSMVGRLVTRFLLGWHFVRCERLVSGRVPFRCVSWTSPNSRALNSKEQMLEVLTQPKGLKLFKTLGHDISNHSVDLKYLSKARRKHKFINAYIIIYLSSTDSFLQSSVKPAGFLF